MSSLNRRQFVLAAGAAACACAVCGGGADELLAAPSGGAKVDVGTLADYPADGVSDKFLKAPHKLLVVRSAAAISAARR